MKSYIEIVEYLKKNKREKHPLLGNGFGMAYDSKIFSGGRDLTPVHRKSGAE
jgi:hypothetical protein